MKQPPLLIALFAFGASSATAPMAQRVARAPDGTIRMTIPARAAVCGDGKFIGEDTPAGFRMHSFHDDGYSVETLQDIQPECSSGPVLLVATKRSGRITDLNAAVGVPWRARSSATDFGTVAVADVSAWLLDLVLTGLPERAEAVAFVVATAADSTRITDRLIAMVRNKTLPTSTRARALRWLSDVARREGRVAETDRLLRELLEDRNEASVVRDRAIRDLAERGASSQDLAAIYDRVDASTLRQRIVRLLVERGDDEAVEKLIQIAQRDGNTAERRLVLRRLAETGHPKAKAFLESRVVR